MDEDVLEELVCVAVDDADPDEVTPPLEPGRGPARVGWLRDFHRRCRSGLTGGDQLTGAVRVDGRVSGSIRLERLPTGDLEYGLWLARAARGRGLSHLVLDLVAQRAVEAGAHRILGRKTADNGPAVATLRRAGAVIEIGPGTEVSAIIDLARG
ncbi:Protein N-acetyltransferase, RimJ/RimL family [Micrococcus terreus]|uniref:Protein N-acetyltransferase, RimJ/RimL family n=1 Tax=Micrococcus terreus TaxID=574650 RepID=A0A1I7MRV5_9MICC|nr:Protein N-acetyltransferase, RimJ/RimL family [Micrococcus terreus]